MMAPPDNSVRVDKALAQLEGAGGMVHRSKASAEFTAGLDIAAIRYGLGEMAQSALTEMAGNIAADLVDDFLSGIGEDAPQAALNIATQEQREHEKQVSQGCMSAEAAADGMKQIDDQCAQAVETLCSGVAFAVESARTLLGQVQGTLVSQPLVQMAVGSVEQLLGARNISLSGILDVLIGDLEPAAQPGRSHEQVCVSQAEEGKNPEHVVESKCDCGCGEHKDTKPVTPTVPAAVPTEPATCGTKPAIPVEANPCDAPPAATAPVSTPTCPPAPAAEAPCAPSSTPTTPAHSVSMTPATAPTTPPPLPTLPAACEVIKAGAEVAGHIVQGVVGSIEQALAPPEPPAASSGSACTISIEVNTECHPAIEAEAPEVAELCSPEPVVEQCPPEPGEDRFPPDTQQVSNISPEGFDKTLQPSVPDEAKAEFMEAKEHAAASPVETPSTEVPPAPELAPSEPPAPNVMQPEFQDQPFESSDQGSTPSELSADSWTPDIWVSGGSPVGVEVEKATSSASSQDVSIARSGQW